MKKHIITTVASSIISALLVFAGFAVTNTPSNQQGIGGVRNPGGGTATGALLLTGTTADNTSNIFTNHGVLRTGKTNDDDFNFQVWDQDDAIYRNAVKCDSFASPACTFGFTGGFGSINLIGSFNGSSVAVNTGATMNLATTTIGSPTDTAYTYLRVDANTGTPPAAADCNVDADWGKMFLDAGNFRLWVCAAPSGTGHTWKSILAS